MDRQQRKSWQEAVTWFCEEQQEKTQWQTIAIKQPKVALWMAVFMLVALIHADALQIKEITRLKTIAANNGFIRINELPNKSRRKTTNA